MNQKNQPYTAVREKRRVGMGNRAKAIKRR